MKKNVIIKTENLSYVYEDSGSDSGNTLDVAPALDNLSIEICEGEYIAILGHNGSGKSTFAKLLNMILTPTSGKIFIDGMDITSDDFTDDDVFEIRKKVGMVFQNPDNQLVATVVEEDVAFGPENLGLERAELRKRVDESLALVNMTEYSKHAPHKLSGGQKQRIAIAGVIAMKPRAIIFDESTAMLDPSGRQDVIGIMERLNKEEGITVINITHYMDEAARADRVVVINDGKLVLDGAPTDVFSQVDLIHSIGLEAPQALELLYKLRKAGFDVSTNMLSDEECVDQIINSLKNRKSK